MTTIRSNSSSSCHEHVIVLFQLVPRIQRLYGSVEEIDLFLGGMIERPASDGGLVGPTFQCLVGDQFKRLKLGDRFWYEEGGHEGALTEGK